MIITLSGEQNFVYTWHLHAGKTFYSLKTLFCFVSFGAGLGSSLIITS